MKSSEILDNFSKFLQLISQDLDQDEVEAWVDKLKLLHFEPNQIQLGGVNQFFRNFIMDHHEGLLKKHLYTCFSEFGLEKNFSINFETNAKQKTLSVEISPKETESTENYSNLNPNFTFDRFVNGGNSDIAYAAAYAVGENLHENKYNPLFICGDVGLGKTHLIQAVGLKAMEREPNLRICYASSKDFINEVIEGIRFQKIQQVRNKYRLVDILMIDDIQFLENKESTQEEFFHIFNELIQNKRQIILTSDRYPREIKNVEERLINRFNSGIVARIFPPDFETRVAIIQQKIATKGLPLSHDVINYLANAIKSNVRDIEGILVLIEANYSLLGQEITMDTIKRILKDVLNIEDNPKTIENIIKLVAQKFDVKVSDLKSEKRTKEISKPRQIAMFIAREVTDLSFPVIAEHFGGKNHTTVIQAHKKTKEWIDKDPEIRQTITSIMREISH